MKGEKDDASIQDEDVAMLAERLKIDVATLAGVMELRGWKPGKSVSDKEFQKAVTDFQTMAAG